jgi:carbon-monoxide dehydrogenase small subunit
VEVDGAPACACLVLAGQADGARVVTAAGLADDDDGLSVLQDAFLEAGAVQCGFCTPGMLVVARHLLAAEPDPTRDRVREALAGNLCRCTGYAKIVDAVLLAAERGAGGPGGR